MNLMRILKKMKEMTKFRGRRGKGVEGLSSPLPGLSLN